MTANIINRPRATRMPTAPSVRDIPRLCSCEWRVPDYRARPHRRAWTLPAAAKDPACRLHRSRDGDAT